MALSPEAIKKRRKSLGASDMAAVVGVSPYKTAADVWHDKVFGRPKADKRLEDLAEWGDLIEPAIREWYKRRLPEHCTLSVPKESLVDLEREWATATPDGIISRHDPKVPELVTERWGLEIKNRGKDDKPRWVDHVPCEVAAQAYWGMFVTGYERWDVVGLTNGNTPFKHTLEWDSELIRAMLVVGEVVWLAVEAGKDGGPPDLSWVESEVGYIRGRLVNESDEAAFRKAAYWRKREGK